MLEEKAANNELNEDYDINSESSFFEDSLNVKNEEETSNEKIGEVLALLDELNSKFDCKIKEDEWKNQKYDEMHSRMLRYQDDLLAKTLDPLLKSVIQLSDSVKKDLTFFKNNEGSNNNLCETLEGIIEQIDAILFDYDIEPMENATEIVNSKEQKIVKTIITNDKSLNNHIEKVLTTGYKKNDKVYRMERVSIYKYVEPEE